MALGIGPMCILPSGPALAEEVSDETRNSARELGRDGVRAFETGNYERAALLLRRAYELVPAPTLALYEARSLAKLGRLVESVERYEVAQRTPLDAAASQAFKDAVREAEQEGEATLARVPRLKLSVRGAGADSPALELRIDGKPYPKQLLDVDRTVDPGDHVLLAEVPGVSHAEEKVFFDERRSYVVTLKLVPATAKGRESPEPAATPAGSSQRTWGWVGLGVGGAGLGFGAVAGWIASGKKSDLDEQCAGQSCPPSAHDEYDSFRTWNTLSIVGYGTGLVGAGVGAVLLLTAKSEPDTQRSAFVPWVGPASAGVSGRF